MRVFELHIDDDRYRILTLVFLTMSDQQRALEFAQEKLAESCHHLGVEVRESGVRLFGLGTMQSSDEPICDRPLTDPAGGAHRPGALSRQDARSA